MRPLPVRELLVGLIELQVVHVLKATLDSGGSGGIRRANSHAQGQNSESEPSRSSSHSVRCLDARSTPDRPHWLRLSFHSIVHRRNLYAQGQIKPAANERGDDNLRQRRTGVRRGSRSFL